MMRKALLFPILACMLMTACQAQQEVKMITPGSPAEAPAENKIAAYAHKFDQLAQPSVSKGTVSGGTLENGRLIPFDGPNFQYFDTTSYLSGRAFVHEKVREIMLNAYQLLETQIPERKFYVMECSQEHGGEMFPHKTHQNGTSIDFMMPKLRDGVPYTALDTIGAEHYWLSFDSEGKYSEDPHISIDFESIAKHLLALQESARRQGYQISKVIFKMEMKDELLATSSGKQVASKGIYITRNLTPLINELHNEHYHVDFEPLRSGK